MKIKFKNIFKGLGFSIASAVFTMSVIQASPIYTVNTASGLETSYSNAATFADFNDNNPSPVTPEFNITGGEINAGAMYIGGTGSFISSGISNRDPVVIEFSSKQDYFGLLWGSPDSGRDRIRFYDGNVEIHSFVLSDYGLNSVSAGFIDIVAINEDAHFDKVALDPSGQIAFEADNLAARAAVVPEPSTYALMVLGLVGLGIYSKKRKK